MKKLKHYEVCIPYLHLFEVDAKNKKEAVEKAISEGDSKICERMDGGIIVEEVELE